MCALSLLKRHRFAFVVIFLFFIVKFFLAFKPHLVGWDESVYLGMGKYLFSFGKVGLWEDIRPIGLSVVLGFFWRLNDSFFLYELILLLFSSGTVFMIYLLAGRFFGRHYGVFAAGLLAFTPIFFNQSSLFMSIIPALFFSLLSIWFFLEEKFGLAGLFSSIAFLFRFPQALVFLSLFLLALFRKDRVKSSIVIAVSFVATSFPFFLLNYFLYYEKTLAFLSPFWPLVRGFVHSGNSFHSISTFTGNFLFYPELLLSFGVIFCFLIFAFFSKKKNLVMLLPFALLSLFYFVIVNKQQRFVLEFFPFVVFFTVAGLYNLVTWYKRNWKLVVPIIMLFVLQFSILSLENISNQFETRPSFEPSIFKFYHLPSSLSGVFLTTTPVPSAYSDNLFIPFYDNLDVAFEDYGRNIQNSDYVIFTENFWPCFNDSCSFKKESLFKLVGKNNLLTKQEWNKESYYLYSN